MIVKWQHLLCNKWFALPIFTISFVFYYTNTVVAQVKVNRILNNESSRVPSLAQDASKVKMGIASSDSSSQDSHNDISPLEKGVEPGSLITQTSSQTPLNEQFKEISCSYQIEPSKTETKPIEIPPLNIKGNTVFSPDEFKQELQKELEKQKISIVNAKTTEEIKKIADTITGIYIGKGYINSLAEIESENINPDGTIKINIIEGNISEIKIKGLKKLNKSYICRRAQLGIGNPFNANRFQDQLNLLRIDPLFENVEASLRPSEKKGLSILTIRLVEANNFTSNFSINNYSPPAVGSERIGVDLIYRNLFGIGDEVAASYYHSFTGGSDIFDFSYQVPLNPMNGTLQLRASPSRNKVTQRPFTELNIRGEQQIYELTYRQPLIRKFTEEFALSLGFAFQNGQTFIFDESPSPLVIGTDDNGSSRTSTIKFSQDYTKRESQGAWFLRSQFSFGIDLFDATINESPTPDGRFLSWLGQVQRVQKLDDNNLLVIQADVQLTPDSLLPAQQFVIGGGQSVRGYRQNARSGDNGFRLGIENRITVQRNEVSRVPTIQLVPFLNFGTVWNHPDNPNPIPEQTFLASGGLGLLWNQEALGISGLSLQLDYGFPFIDLSDRGNNAQDNGFYFNIRYQP